MFEAPSVINIHTPTSSFAIIHSRWLPEHLGILQSADDPYISDTGVFTGLVQQA